MSEAAGSRPSTPKGTPARVPGATGSQIRRRAAALQSGSKKDVDAPQSMRAAGAGGSTSTMMKLYTQDENPGLKV
ncbi:Arf guanine nucleotide exchange factor sbh1 [Microbotryomycetes sp. JL221]|nr:Arf guanine nucleotide exchange factor sbh1 [Microbotryomycetes sp. JL221]